MTNGVVYVRMNERIYIHMYVHRMYGRMHIQAACMTNGVVYDDVTYVYNDVTYVYDDVTYG